MKLNNMTFIGAIHTIFCLYISLFLSTHVNTQQTRPKFPNFDQYVNKFNKTYSKEQYQKRKLIYQHNLQIIQASNCLSCGANSFADWTTQQIQKLKTVKKSIKRDKIGATSTILQHQAGRLLIQSTPSEFDWRNFTDMTSVKNQGYCGASWAFSAAAFFQQDAILNGLVSNSSSFNLSQQYLITCNRQNQGCQSGYIQTSMDLVIDKGGIPLQSQYPYRPFLSQNSNMCFETNLFKIANYTRISYYDIENAQTIKKIILKKPVNVGICGSDLIYYYPSSNSTGARTLKCKSSNRVIDHSVLLIGYTQNQWIIKNQWGSGWGLNGYAYISRKSSEDCCIGQQMYSSGVVTQTCLVSNCKVCVQNNTCYRCIDGYYVQHNQTTGVQTCMPCIQTNCLECYNYFGRCRQCIEGYALNFSSGKCINSSIANCNLLSGNACLQCHRGFKLNSAKTACAANCNVRSCIKCSDGPCTICKNGYSLLNVTINGTNTQKCVLNPCTVGNCTFCNSTGACIQCYGTFNLSNGVCVNTCNISGCISCTTTTCSECVQGKSRNTTTNTCEAYNAFPNCRTHNKTTCTTCKPGYSFNSNRTSCNQVCQNSTCSNCSKADTGICRNCSNGYYLVNTSYQFYCVANPCNLTNCTLCSADGLTCLTCSNAYYVWNSSANRCQSQCKIANCLLCLPTDTKCNTCNPGYAVSFQTKLCRQSNISNCPTIYQYSDGSYDCQACATNYVLADNYMKCKIWCNDYWCQVCKEQALDICLKCYDGYSLQFSNGILACLKNIPQMEGCILITQNQTYCFQCQKYYLRDKNTGKCTLNTQNCVQGCIYCTPPDYEYGFSCFCKSGLTFQWFSEVCLTSNPLNNSCPVISDYGNNVYYCEQCPKGQVVSSSGKACEPQCKVANCSICDQQYNTVCVTCMNGFWLDPSKACVVCSTPDCDICNGIRCLACKSGFDVNPKGDKCTKIQCKPSFIFDGYSCLCPVSTYMSQETCLPCNQNSCIDCNQNTCFLCKQGFYLHQSYCQHCKLNCKICKQNNTCQQCIDGYFYQNSTARCLSLQSYGRAYLIVDNMVVQCPTGCVSCNVLGVCLKCTVGFVLDGSGCSPCQGNCQNCYMGSLTKCKSCYIGYYLQNNTCLKCSDSNCIDCSKGIDTCLACIDGYYVQNNACAPCLQKNCIKCDSSGSCTDCRYGFTLLSNNTCIACIGDCKTCNSSNLTQCITVCSINQIQINQTCTSCPKNCQYCTDPNFCIQCVQNYVLNVSNLCQKKCQSGCFQCDQQNVTKCKKCFAGYFLSQSNICIPDIICNENSSCSSCPVLWSLQNSTCTICDVDGNCLQCANGDSQKCIQCAQGYYIQNKGCSKCQNGCKDCLQLDKCKSCADGYFLKSGQFLGICQKCDINCLTCKERSNKCTSCNSTLILSSIDNCVSQQKVVSQIKLNCPVNQYPLKSQKVTEDIQNALGNDYAGQVKCTKYRQGSTIATIQITVPTTTTPAEVLQSYLTLVSTLTSLGGVPLISIQKTQLIIPSKGNMVKTDSGNTTLTIILAVVIPSVVLLLFVAGYVIRKRIGSINNAVQNQSQQVMRQKQIERQRQSLKVQIKSKLQPIPEQSPTKILDKNNISTQGYRTLNFNDTSNFNQNSHQYLGQTVEISRAQMVHEIQQNAVQQIFRQQKKFNKNEDENKILPPNINDLSQIRDNRDGQNNNSLNKNEQIQFEDETLRHLNKTSRIQQLQNNNKQVRLKSSREPPKELVVNNQMDILDFEEESSQF